MFAVGERTAVSVFYSNLRRQWIPVAGGSCDVRMGAKALKQVSKAVKDSVGTPRVCMMVMRESTDADLLEDLRRQIVDVGFSVCWHVLADGAAATVEAAAGLFDAFAREHVTSEDLCCALGDAEVLALASHACSLWCGGMSLVAIPQDEIALLEGTLIPRALDVGPCKGMVSVSACARRVLLDYDWGLSELGSEEATYARCLMVSAAMCSSERAFSALWDKAEQIMGGNQRSYVDQLMEAAKLRGQTVSSTAVAVRQSLDYGQSFARAIELASQTSFAHSSLLAEGMRFCARVSVAMEKLSIDDMLAQDELLDTLGIGTVSCVIEPEALVDALKEELLRRTNRIMLLVPQGIGRVRLATVPDELLLEHASAWCDAHATS